jgi:hypothetical protein
MNSIIHEKEKKEKKLSTIFRDNLKGFVEGEARVPQKIFIATQQKTLRFGGNFPLGR